MAGRETGHDYRYGMNGQMKEGEVFEGFMSADFWGYDSRLGRRWEMDPLACEWQSPYATFDNSPILFADPSGLQVGDGDRHGDKKKRQDPVPERETRRDNIPATGSDQNPGISKGFPEIPVQLNLYPDPQSEVIEGMVEQGITLVGNCARFVHGLGTGETWESMYNMGEYMNEYMGNRYVRMHAAFATYRAIENHFLDYSPNTLGKDMVNVTAAIAPFAFKAPVVMDVPVYEPAIISYEGIDAAIARGAYVEDLMVNDLTQLYPNLKAMRQARIKFEGYSATMKADLVLIEETLDGPVIRIIGESKYGGSPFSEGQKLLYVHKEYAILVGKNGEELMYFNPDAIELLEYRFAPEGTYNITPH